jgi:excisionase family DNA binding protein
MVESEDEQPLVVTVAEAARRFGKSVRTVRRWMAEGRLPAVETPTGRMVDLSGFFRPGEGAEPGRREAARGGPADAPDAAELERQVARLQGEVEKLNALVQQLSGERDYLRQALAAALGVQRMLLATRADAPPPHRPWWRFWERGRG